jgi:hypothetical protein
MVRKAGFEPACPCEHYPLKVACLPIPPLPHLTLCHIKFGYIFIKLI